MKFLVLGGGALLFAVLVHFSRRLFSQDDYVSAEALGSIRLRHEAEDALEESLGAPTPRKRERAPSRDRAADGAYRKEWRHSS